MHPEIGKQASRILGGFGIVGAGITTWILLVLAPRAAAKFAEQKLDLPAMTKFVIWLTNGIYASVLFKAVFGVILAAQLGVAAVGALKGYKGVTVANGVIWFVWLIITPLALLAVYLPTL